MAGFQLTVPSFMWNRRLKLRPSSLPRAADARAGASFLFASATLLAISSGSFSVYRRPKSDVAPTSSSSDDSRLMTGPVWVCVAEIMTWPPGMPVAASICRRASVTTCRGSEIRSHTTRAAFGVADFEDDGLGVDVVEDGPGAASAVVAGERGALGRGDDGGGGPDPQVGGDGRGRQNEEEEDGSHRGTSGEVPMLTGMGAQEKGRVGRMRPLGSIRPTRGPRPRSRRRRCRGFDLVASDPAPGYAGRRTADPEPP